MPPKKGRSKKNIEEQEEDETAGRDAESKEDASDTSAMKQADDLFGGFVGLAAGAGKLPNRLSNCAYDPAGRAWLPKNALRHVPKSRRDGLLAGFSYQVEEARTGASGCKRCGEKIGKAILRVGYPTKDHRGEYGAIPVWFHVDCIRTDETLLAYAKMGDTKLRKTVLGYDALQQDVRHAFRAQLLRTANDAELTSEPLPAVAETRKLAQHPAPKFLKVALLPFQAEGLSWLLAQETDSATRGGILADEMGMGKTLQTISLILAGEIKGATLVVCPAAAMLQWRNEVLRFTEPGSVEVRLHYGSDRATGLDDLSGVIDRRVIVLTTYQTLEHEYRKEINRYKIQCEWCKRFFLKEKLAFHQKYFCGPDAERTEKQQKSQRKSELKSEAVKKMKIGGQETEIMLNPLNAIRTAATAALRQLPGRKELSEAKTRATPFPTGMPFPVSVLPEEAQAALGYAPKEVSSASVETPSQSSKRRRTSKGPSDDRTEVEDIVKATPSPVDGPKRRWRLNAVSQEPAMARGQIDENQAAASMATPDAKSRTGSAWGHSLQKRPQKVQNAVIDLDLGCSQDDGSDLELVQAVQATTPTAIWDFASTGVLAPASAAIPKINKKKKT